MFDLFKGATRPPMMFGVPTMAILYLTVFVGVLSMSIHLALWLVWPIAVFSMSLYTKQDERAFRQLGLYAQTKLQCKKATKKLWGASSFTPLKRTEAKNWFK